MRKREHSASPIPPGQEQGRILLAELLPVAKARAASISEDWVARFEGEAALFAPYCRLDNLAGIEIYQGEKGWHTDIVLAQHPPQGDRLRSPSQQPFADQEDAIEYALNLMVMMIKTEAFGRGLGANPAHQDTHLWFRLHGQWIGLPASAHVAIRHKAQNDPRSTADILRDLGLSLRAAMPRGFDAAGFRALSDGARKPVMSLINLALHRGVTIYPQPDAQENLMPQFDGDLGEPGRPGPGGPPPTQWLH